MELRAQFEKRLDIFLDNPYAPILNNHSVEETFPGCRSINITGDYRAIYEAWHVVPVFVKIGTHHELYGK